MFEFLAQQGQHLAVWKVLRSLGLNPTVRDYCGTRNNFGGCCDPDHCDQIYRRGVLVRVRDTRGLSKGAINRAIKKANVPGA